MSVFISHSSKDELQYGRMCLALTRKKIEYWDAESMIVGGSLKEQLKSGINKCKVCIFMMTKNSLESGWCKAEIGAFWGAGITVITFIAETELQENDIPIQLKGDLYTNEINKVVESVQFHISQSVKHSILDYGIKVTAPANGAPVHNRFEIEGIYTIKPPEKLFRVLEFNPTQHEYWPKPFLIFNDNLKTWYAQIYIGANVAGKRELKIAAVGGNGNILLEYAARVFEKTHSWPGIPNLTPDITICDSVTIIIPADS